MFKARGEGGLFLRSRIKGGEIRFRDDEFCWQFLGFTRGGGEECEISTALVVRLARGEKWHVEQNVTTLSENVKLAFQRGISLFLFPF